MRAILIAVTAACCLVLVGCAGTRSVADPASRGAIVGRLVVTGDEFSTGAVQLADFRLLNRDTGDHSQLLSSWHMVVKKSTWAQQGFFFIDSPAGSYSLIKMPGASSRCACFRFGDFDLPAGSTCDLGIIAVSLNEAREDLTGDGGVAFGGTFFVEQQESSSVLEMFKDVHPREFRVYGAGVVSPLEGDLDAECLDL